MCAEPLGSSLRDFPKDYFDAFAVSYSHIEQIDRHRPWTDPACARILDRVKPLYLTHELKSTAQGDQMRMTRRQLSVRIGGHQILRDVSLSVEEGGWLMLAGPNGAGKSTVVNAISRAVPYDGEILWRGEDVRRMRSHVLARHLGILSQTHSVGYSFSVEEVVRLGRYAHAPGIFSPRGGGEEQINRALEETGLTELREQSVLTLSRGELQRVFLAQLFAQNPELLILDEPTNHLDMVYQKQIFALLSEWLRQPGRAVISVVHDLSLAMAYGTSAVLLDRGEAVSSGPVREVLSPDHLRSVYGMDVYGWMRQMLEQWQDP